MSGVPLEFAGKFGDALRSARKSCGLLQIALANEIGVPDSYISKWENGSMYPSVGQLNAVRNALKLTDKEFEPLYFSWKREADAIPPAFMARGQRPAELVTFVDQSIGFARQMRRSGQPRMAMSLCERDVGYAYNRIKELRWSPMHLHVLARIAELLVEQCKAGLDFLSRADVRHGAVAEVLGRLRIIEEACANEVTHFYAELATEGTTYVGGDVGQAFGQSMKLIDNQDAIPVAWQPEVLRASAINAGKLENRDALERIEALIERLLDATSGRIGSGEQAFVLEGLARGWARLDPERGQETIERAWKARRDSSDAESGSLLRHVQLVRSEAEIAATDLEGADSASIAKKIRDGLRISEENGYDRYADQFKRLLKEFT
jgi:transcriptional regulator with XRE-family HTH domain